MTYIFYTFRPQISDQALFEDFFKLFVPFVKSHKEYAYSVESDGTLSKHLHAIIGSPSSGKDYQDLDKFYQKFNKANGLREFKDFAKKHANTSEIGFKPMKVKDTPEDLLHTLGYTLKEHVARQETNFPNTQVLEAIEYYFAYCRIKAKDNPSKDWTLLSGKNAHAHIERYIQENDITLPDPFLGVKLVADRYSFVNLTEKQSKQVQAEIHLALAKEAGIDPDSDEKEQVFTYTNNTKDSFLFESVEPLAKRNVELETENNKLRNQLVDLEKRHQEALNELVRVANKGYSPVQAAYES